MQNHYRFLIFPLCALIKYIYVRYEHIDVIIAVQRHQATTIYQEPNLEKTQVMRNGTP